MPTNHTVRVLSLVSLLAACRDGSSTTTPSNDETSSPKTAKTSAAPVSSPGESAAPQPIPRAEDFPAKDAARPAGTPCDELTAQGCLQSKECVLEAPPKGSSTYVCRAAVKPCEGGIAQSDANFEKDCNARKGCSIQPSNCFCPTARTKVAPPKGSNEERFTSSMACACGGGNYERCAPNG
ncbi:MAG: hypothetical protein U0271_34940 [Polyangiaceae bacterium]